MAALIAGFLTAPHHRSRGAQLTATGGILFSLGAFCFVYNLWRTFSSAEARQRARRSGSSGGPALPTLGE